ncbi:RagB/SusD family nutrient uptake outer membrane protein [Segetibacter sp.]|jgi:tetratricopeptide (TPR) repeat protein|uniref:RagB/SusD family nutrient uptake outer membrane protein n=1 Tax=Segetibacter sp. TaxID=2231182 RepID=UPI00261D2AE4|nr:RagB/SusD family nutrient uptake outer membrane protein [Segetibacter sp.]MCW3078593.1 RagB/SusD domain protein [Segetibacter sp.]
MRHNYFIKAFTKIFLLGTVLSMSSCEKFLETKQYDRSNEAAFYKSASDFEQAVVGSYSTLSSLYHSGNFYFLLTDIRSDNTSVYVPGGSGGPLSKSEYDDFTLTSNNEHLLGYWNVSYSLIQKTNDIISFVAGSSIDPLKKNQYRGEAEVLRALAYFNLVRLYGGVPLVLGRFDNIDDSYKKGRNTVDEVYSQIITDLKDAQTLLVTNRSTGDNSGRADKGIATSLLGNVYLTQKKYAEAAVEFKKVIDMNVYTLMPNYADLFKSGQQGNSETIWQAYYIAGVSGLGSSFPNFSAPLSSETVLIQTGLAFGWNQPTADIQNTYESKDVRRNSIGDGFTKAANYYPYKFIKNYVDIGAGTGDGNSGKDWYILRYADVLLMYAEAVNESEGPTNAYSSIDKVRTRAGLDPLPTGLSKDQFREAVYLEERRESPFEGHRWFDLVRTGRALSVMNAKVKPLSDANTIGLASPIDAHHLLLPIPSIVREMAPQVTQNPGY